MLREILYGETYDESPNNYTKIGERGGSRKSTKVGSQKIRQTAL